MQDRPLNILLIANPQIPVPPKTYGGIERSVAMLVEGLTRQGHGVTLMANAQSHVPCKLIPYTDRARQSKPLRALAKARFYWLLRRAASGVDLIHSFSRADYLLPVLGKSVPKILNHNTVISREWTGRIHRQGGDSVHFVSISDSLSKDVRDIGRWTTIHNAVDLTKFNFRPNVAPDAPLVFLGLTTRMKGIEEAIRIARASGRKLKIAGGPGCVEEDKRYFDEQVTPSIDGRNVEFIGEVDDAQKNALLGNAAALLFPIQWDTEAFGRVMIEAMACGTPVLATRRAANPEVVTDGVTGFLGASVDDLVKAAGRLGQLDRAACRRVVQERFSSVDFIKKNLALYRTALSEMAGKRGRPA